MNFIRFQLGFVFDDFNTALQMQFGIRGEVVLAVIVGVLGFWLYRRLKKAGYFKCGKPLF